MDKIDKTKEKLGINGIDDKTKKQLFEKFVDAGGKVVNDKKRASITIDRERQRQLLRKYEATKGKSQKSEKKPAAPEKKPVKKPVSIAVPPSGFLDLLALKFKLLFFNLTNFDGYYFNKKFFEKFHLVYTPALIDLQMLYLELFKKNLKTGDLVLQGIDKIRPIYYELIDLIGNLYDKILMDQIVEQYIKFSNVPKRVTELKEPILQIYRNLRIIYPYKNSLLDGFNYAITIYAKASEDKSFSASSAKRRSRNSNDIIFSKLFPRLHLLFCNYSKTNYLIEDPRIDKILGITESELPGGRSRVRSKDQESAKQTEEEVQEEAALPLSVRRGLSLMSKLDMVSLRTEADKEQIFSEVGNNDKVLATYILFFEFDKEYSVILTTNKIKYNDNFGAHEVQHYRTRLQDLYNQMRKPFLSLRNYAEEHENVEKLKKQKSNEGSQYIEFTKQLETLEKKKLLASKDARMSVKQYMEKVASELDTLIEDISNKQIYISNPTEILEFDPNIEGEKKINGKIVSEAIAMAYCFASALSYRLSLGGDLTGDIEFSEVEMNRNINTSAPQPESGEDPAKPGEDNDKDKTIIDELQDMV